MTPWASLIRRLFAATDRSVMKFKPWFMREAFLIKRTVARADYTVCLRPSGPTPRDDHVTRLAPAPTHPPEEQWIQSALIDGSELGKQQGAWRAGLTRRTRLPSNGSNWGVLSA